MRHSEHALQALVHTFKGLVGNIGARGLLARSAALEAALLSDGAHAPTVDTCLSEALQALEAVIAEIDRLGQPTSPGGNEAPTHSLPPGLDWDELTALVAEQDAQAREHLDTLLGHWPDLRRHPRIAELRRALERYDFEQAAAVLAALQA